MKLKKKLLRLFFIIEIFIFFIFYIGGVNGLNSLVELRKANEKALEQIKILDKDVDQLEIEVYKWENDFLYKEKVAREQLQMVRPNEQIYYIVESKKGEKMYKLPKLPYSFNALEPSIDERTLEIHYTKHHQGYVDKLNKALEQHPELFDVSLLDLLKNIDRDVPTDIRDAVRDNGGGHWNHSMFWKIMSENGGGQPKGELLEAIKKSFGSFENFKEIFSKVATEFVGSGWTWLIVDKDNNLLVATTLNHMHPVRYGLRPILVLDIWEHAYYLKYQNRRKDFIEEWWKIVNWDEVEKFYKDGVKLELR